MGTLLFGLMGGLSLFIFGMNLMGDGLQKAAGDRMRRILEVLTGIPIVGVLVGTLVTSIIQSSSATTVMVVGFVNAGLMSLNQAIGVIMGANIGTTVTAQLIAFKITHFIFPLITVGFGVYFLGKRKSTKYIGQVILGFGILMLGMDTMSDAMKPLRDFQGFQDFMTSYGRVPLLGLFIGLVLTMLIQSSSASIAILIAVASQGLISLETAVPILLGSNIGTCVTAVLASIGTNLTARRAVLFHVLFNVFGSILFLLILPFFLQMVLLVSPVADIARQIANAHTIFNVLNTTASLPVIGLFIKVIKRLTPGKEVVVAKGPIYLDERMLNTPGIALSLATKELIRMANMAEQNVREALESFFQNDIKKLRQVFEREDVIDELESAITTYLAKLSQREMSPSLSRRHTGLLHAVNDIERVGDHAENIAQMASVKIEDKLPFSEQAVGELKQMQDMVQNAFLRAIQALQHDNQELARQIGQSERDIDMLERELRKSHISRLNAQRCFPASGVVFLDIISNLERVGDHSFNIAQVVLDEL